MNEVKQEDQHMEIETDSFAQPSTVKSEFVTPANLPQLSLKTVHPDLSMQAFTENILVGEGTYGQVFRSRLANYQPCSQDQWPANYRAVKKAKMQGEKDGFPITSLREIQVLRTLNHPNCVKLESVLTEKTELSQLMATSNGENVASAKDVQFVFEYVPYDLVGLLSHKPQYSVQ